jgi:hypothetical protein
VRAAHRARRASKDTADPLVIPLPVEDEFHHASAQESKSLLEFK